MSLLPFDGEGEVIPGWAAINSGVRLERFGIHLKRWFIGGTGFLEQLPRFRRDCFWVAMTSAEVSVAAFTPPCSKTALTTST